MDNKNPLINIVLFIVLSSLVLLGWNYMFPPPPPPAAPAAPVARPAPASGAAAPGAEPAIGAGPSAKAQAGAEKAKAGRPIRATTDVFDLVIDEKSTDIREATLTRFNSSDDEKKNYKLFWSSPERSFFAGTGLLNESNIDVFSDAGFKVVGDGARRDMRGDNLSVSFVGESDNLRITKTYAFERDSYLIGVTAKIENLGAQTRRLYPIYQLLRDSQDPPGASRLAYTYTGPVVYTPDSKFVKVPFADLDKNDADYPKSTQTGWLGYIQHYFLSTWILQEKGKTSVCGQGLCQIDVKRRASDGLYSVGLIAPMQTIAPGQSAEVSIKLYAGPQSYNRVVKIADNLQLVQDFGKVRLFAAPLFWLMQQFYNLVGNWGWAIVLLVVLVKLCLFPLSLSAYKSMAHMRLVAPKLKEIQRRFKDDKQQLNIEMMQLYQKEKINPLSGCLPMLIQMPVFIGLYWVLLTAVELRQAPWLGWITDLARTDPYFILPLFMTATMYLQTLLNPATGDPVQQKMMRIMPLIFSAMFFFFPAGLVLYYCVNNVLSIIQQWYITKKVERQYGKPAQV